MTLIWFIIVLGVIVFIHELGHFLVAKWCGVYVDCFSLGFGPRLLWLKVGETEYRVSLIPLGGYVRMAGQFDVPEEYDKESADRYKDVPAFRRYDKQTIPKRMAIIVAGPLMNLVFALPVAFALLVLGTPEAITTDATTIGAVVPGGPAAEAGLESGDKILSVNDVPVKTWQNLTQELRFRLGEETEVKYLRMGKEFSVVLTPKIDHEKSYMGIGIDKIELAQVAAINSNTPASKSNLQVGDVIDKIIGISTVDLSLSEIKDYLRNNPGMSIVLGVKRYPEIRYFSESNTYEFVKFPLTIERAGKFKYIDVAEYDGSSIILCDESAPENFPVKSLDKIIEINGEKVSSGTVNEKIYGLPEGKATVNIERIEGKIVKKLFTTNVVLTVVNSGRIGTSLIPAQQIVKRRVWPALLASPETAYNEFLGVLHVLRMLIQKKLGLKSLAGPVGIARITGDAARAGASALLFITLMLTVNLGILNLLPLPVLDGGHVVLLCAESIYRKPLPIKFVLWYQKIGFTFLMLLMVYVLYNDVISWIIDSDKLGLLLGKFL